MSNTYRCPVCKVIADIDLINRIIGVTLPPGMFPPMFPVPGHNCPLAKSIDEIDLSKLEKVDW